MKKRLISISLAVLLAMGLSIMVFPAQAVEAWGVPGGAHFHIQAEGEGTYIIGHPNYAKEKGTGEFSLNVAGQKGYAYKQLGWYHHGLMVPSDTVQGYISGSFSGITASGEPGEHELDITLTNPKSDSPGALSKRVRLDDEGRLERVAIKFKGTYNGTYYEGNKIKSGLGYIDVYYDENEELDYIRARLSLFSGQQMLYIRIDGEFASVDLHQNPNY